MNTNIVVQRPLKGDVITAVAGCGNGERVVGGGYNLQINEFQDVHQIALLNDRPNQEPPESWLIQFIVTDNFGMHTELSITAFAQCLGVTP